MSDQPLISIIVPIQEHDCLPETLEALAGQQQVAHDEFEILAIDSLYQHDWPAVVAEFQRRFPRLQLSLARIEETHSRASQLNSAIPRARADLLLMLADDFIPCPTLVHEHLQLHRARPQDQVVGIGPGLFPPDDSTSDFMHWLEDSGAIFGVPFSDPGLQLPAQYFYMANTSLKRKFLGRAGKFNEVFPYDAMDDLEMGARLARLGMRSVYLPGAVATHRHIISFQDRCQVMERAGESAALYDLRSGREDGGRPGRKRTRVRRGRETREQRYQRVLAGHFNSGYRRAIRGDSTASRVVSEG